MGQQLYGGLLRCVSLGPTEGLSTWSCGVKFIFQPVVVPVGKLCLGRIFNVLGTSVDLYEDLPQSVSYMKSSFFELRKITPQAALDEVERSAGSSTSSRPTLSFIESIGPSTTNGEQLPQVLRTCNENRLREAFPSNRGSSFYPYGTQSRHSI